MKEVRIISNGWIVVSVLGIDVEQMEKLLAGLLKLMDSFLKWNGRASDHVQSLLTILSKTFSSTGAFVQLFMYSFMVCDVFTYIVIVDWCTPTRSYTNLTDLCSECNYFHENTELIWMQEFHSHVLEVSLELSTYLQEQGLGFMCAHSWGFCSGDVIFSYRSPPTGELYECSFVSLPVPLWLTHLMSTLLLDSTATCGS